MTDANAVGVKRTAAELAREGVAMAQALAASERALEELRQKVAKLSQDGLRARRNRSLHDEIHERLMEAQKVVFDREMDIRAQRQQVDEALGALVDACRQKLDDERASLDAEYRAWMEEVTAANRKLAAHAAAIRVLQFKVAGCRISGQWGIDNVREWQTMGPTENTRVLPGVWSYDRETFDRVVDHLVREMGLDGEQPGECLAVWKERIDAKRNALAGKTPEGIAQDCLEQARKG